MKTMTYITKLLMAMKAGSPGYDGFSPDKFKEETVKLGTNAVIFEKIQ